jgi:hypothetical protein
MCFESLLERHERGELSQVEAAVMPGASERTFRRWGDRYREDGQAGLLDRRIRKPSARWVPESELARAGALCAEIYGGFTIKHSHEKVVERHGHTPGCTVTRLALQSPGLVRPAKRRGAPGGKRPPRFDGPARQSSRQRYDRELHEDIEG